MNPGDSRGRGGVPPPKLPPPAHGIRASRFGATWWGRRWIQALERFGSGYSLRLGRGRSYARAGRVHDLSVHDTVVRARVTGSRPEPYEVTVRLTRLADSVWERGIRAMAAKALFAARLLAGEMPHEIDETFRRCGRSLFPERAQDLATSCSCPDWANPCKHVAAVHYVLGEFLDRDPFLLFELRGRSKDRVLGTLRQLRAGPDDVTQSRPVESTGTAGGVVLSGIPRERYDAFRARVDDLRFRIEAPAVEGAILRQLGRPASWRLPTNPRDLLQPVVTRAAVLARELALGLPAEKSE